MRTALARSCQVLSLLSPPTRHALSCVLQVASLEVPGLLHFIYLHLSGSQHFSSGFHEQWDNAPSRPVRLRCGAKRSMARAQQCACWCDLFRISSAAPTFERNGTIWTAMPCALSSAVPRLQTRNRLWRRYQQLHCCFRDSSRKLVCEINQHECMVAMSGSGYELYAAFKPLVTASAASNGCEAIVRWIKRQESAFFVPNPPTWKS